MCTTPECVKLAINLTCHTFSRCSNCLAMLMIWAQGEWDALCDIYVRNAKVAASIRPFRLCWMMACSHLCVLRLLMVISDWGTVIFTWQVVWCNVCVAIYTHPNIFVAFHATERCMMGGMMGTSVWFVRCAAAGVGPSHFNDGRGRSLAQWPVCSLVVDLDHNNTSQSKSETVKKRPMQRFD